MNRFYVIAADSSDPQNEFILKYFDGKISKNIPSKFGPGLINIETIYIEAKLEDYDNKFVQHLLSLEPVFKVHKFLDFHFENYNQAKDEFLSQIQYIILPLAKNRSPREGYINAIENWITMKDTKTNNSTYSVQIGTLNAPFQLQQNTQNSNQSLEIQNKDESIKEILECLKKDIINLNEENRESLSTEIAYTLKQLERGRDIKLNLLDIGSQIKEIGMSFFVNLASSGVFEIIKPSLGL